MPLTWANDPSWTLFAALLIQVDDRLATEEID